MPKTSKSTSVVDEVIMNKIYVISEQKVMIDRDLAALYNVETKVLKQAVKRNIGRFPKDFMFEMNNKEFENWRSQTVTSNFEDKMGFRYAPFCFTEQGVTRNKYSVVPAIYSIEYSLNIATVYDGFKY